MNTITIGFLISFFLLGCATSSRHQGAQFFEPFQRSLRPPSLSTRGAHTCSLAKHKTQKGVFEDRAICWGDNSYGQLGRGHEKKVSGGAAFVLTEKNPVEICVGYEHSCLLTEDDSVQCFGQGANGRLGDGEKVGRSHPSFVLVKGPSRKKSGTKLLGVRQLACGYNHTCALDKGGSVRCWGYGAGGRLGNGRSRDREFPAKVLRGKGRRPLLGILQISAGAAHTCALTEKHQVLCWGKGAHGRLGHGKAQDQKYPAFVLDRGVPLAKVKSISAGAAHTCALMDSGKVKCWGRGSFGRLGHGKTTDVLHPVEVLAGRERPGPLTGVIHLSAGDNHSCALMEAGELMCWGRGDNGRLGNGTTEDQSYPVTVLAGEGAGPLLNVARVSAGDVHTCALTTEGLIKCWGTGKGGLLGRKTTEDSFYPISVEWKSF
ncbi:MAG: hypothetical protein OXB88_02150 [Bacteriovoracales bacterium]|nr:hypothetical protein [Bacteriovoracales bacterium]